MELPRESSPREALFLGGDARECRSYDALVAEDEWRRVANAEPDIKGMLVRCVDGFERLVARGRNMPKAVLADGIDQDRDSVEAYEKRVERLSTAIAERVVENVDFSTVMSMLVGSSGKDKFYSGEDVAVSLNSNTGFIVPGAGDKTVTYDDAVEIKSSFQRDKFVSDVVRKMITKVNRLMVDKIQFKVGEESIWDKYRVVCSVLLSNSRAGQAGVEGYDTVNVSMKLMPRDSATPEGEKGVQGPTAESALAG